MLIFELILVVAGCILVANRGVVDSAGIKISGGFDQVASSISSSNRHQDVAHRKAQLAHILNRPGHSLVHVDNWDSPYAKEKPGAFLYAMLMSHYNVDILPVNSTSAAVGVRLLLKLTQIVDVDEKNQIMTTNVWLRHEWYDSNLKWDPKQFGGIETLNIPSEEIWLPDTILYNNADGDYQITIQTKAEVRFDGLVVWEPPAIYKSFCRIDVEFFPYDTQNCEMKKISAQPTVGPWTFDVSKVDYLLVGPEGNTSGVESMAADMTGFYESVEWDVLKVSGNRRVFQYPCCEESFVDITYLFYIRRKTLFYTINLIIPCVFISFLTVLVFYLPCQSGEKVALSISTLLSLTWFILLLSEIIPPTSLALPLMGKYLLFTMILVVLSIAVTVLVVYNHFRHPYAYAMPHWIRYVFLHLLPRLLQFETMMDESRQRNSPDGGGRWSKNSSFYNYLLRHSEIDGENATAANAADRGGSGDPTSPSHQFRRRTAGKILPDDVARMRYGALLSCHEEGEFIINEALPAIDQYMALPEIREAIKCIHYITRRYRTGKFEAKMKSDWEAVSRVLDRLFLIIFSLASTLGTLAILLRAPSLYDPTPALVASDPQEIFFDEV